MFIIWQYRKTIGRLLLVGFSELVWVFALATISLLCGGGWWAIVFAAALLNLKCFDHGKYFTPLGMYCRCAKQRLAINRWLITTIAMLTCKMIVSAWRYGVAAQILQYRQWEPCWNERQQRQRESEAELIWYSANMLASISLAPYPPGFGTTTSTTWVYLAPAALCLWMVVHRLYPWRRADMGGGG